MTKEELKEYLKNNLTLNVKKDWDYYSEDPDIFIELILEGEIIAEVRT